MQVDRAALPKIGFVYAFTTSGGQRAGVVAHRTGRRDLVLYDPDDPDRMRYTVVLTGAEPRTVAELLGLPVVVDHMPNLTRSLAAARGEDLRAVRIPVPAVSPYAGRTLSDTRARTRTGASIVAVLRDDRTITASAPRFQLRHGDSVVAVGDAAAITALQNLLVSGHPNGHPAD